MIQTTANIVIQIYTYIPSTTQNRWKSKNIYIINYYYNVLGSGILKVGKVHNYVYIPCQHTPLYQLIKEV